MINKYSLYQYLFFGFLGVALIGVAVWMWHEQRQYAKSGVLTVGLIKGRPIGSPTDMVEGFDWDLSYFIAQKLYKHLEFKVFWISNFESALQNEEVDVISASMVITDERLKRMAMIHVFSEPYPYLALLFWEHSYHIDVDHVKHIRDMNVFFKKHAIGVVQGSIWENLLKEYGIINLKTYDNEHTLVFGLKDGEVAAIVIGRVATDILLKQNSSIWALRVALDKPYGYGIGIALKKERQDLVKQIANVIQELKGDGTITMLQQKWFGKIY
jgi:arginine transport system substrate-binding protein